MADLVAILDQSPIKPQFIKQLCHLSLIHLTLRSPTSQRLLMRTNIDIGNQI